MATAAFLNGVECARETLTASRVARVRGPEQREWVVRIGDHEAEVVFVAEASGAHITIEGETLTLQSDWVPGYSVFRGALDGTPLIVEIDRLDMGYQLTTSGVSQKVVVLTPRQSDLYHRMPEKIPADTSNLLLCPMPGLVVKIHVKAGDEVSAGQALAIIEAMKMENILRAEKDGRIEKVSVKAGDSLAVDDVILEFE